MLFSTSNQTKIIIKLYQIKRIKTIEVMKNIIYHQWSRSKMWASGSKLYSKKSLDLQGSILSVLNLGQMPKVTMVLIQSKN
jgi:hypothetical protein